jgi:hypothetical protein
MSGAWTTREGDDSPGLAKIKHELVALVAGGSVQRAIRSPPLGRVVLHGKVTLMGPLSGEGVGTGGSARNKGETLILVGCQPTVHDGPDAFFVFIAASSAD